MRFSSASGLLSTFAELNCSQCPKRSPVHEEGVLFWSLVQAGTASDCMASAPWDQLGLASAEPTMGSLMWPIRWLKGTYICELPMLPISIDASLYVYPQLPHKFAQPRATPCKNAGLWTQVLLREILSTPLETGSRFSALSNLLCCSTISLLPFFT